MKVDATGAPSGFTSRLKAINLRPSVDASTAPESSEGGSGDRQSNNSSRPSGDTPAANGVGRSAGTYGPSGEAPAGQSDGETAPDRGEESSSASPAGEAELSDAERRTLDKLKRIDQRVRAHEQAHLAAAGQYAQGGISLEFVTGPDGQQYAVGGSVQLDTSEAGTPEETVRKMQQVKQAAIAPADPSSQDQQVAVEASRKLAEARSELQESSDQEAGQSNGEFTSSSDSSSGSGSENAGGFEGPEDIGIDVGQRTGTYIADRRSGSSNESGSAANASSGSSSPNTSTNPLNQFITGASNQATGRSGQVFNAIA